MKEKIFSSSVVFNLQVFPEILEDSLKMIKHLQLPYLQKKFDKIILAGMGGSGIAGKIVQAVLREKIKSPIFVENSATLPNWVDEKTLLIISTYSGNTVEALKIFQKAIEKKLAIFVLSSGGEILKLSRKYKVPLILLPTGLQPRAALGYFLAPIFFILDKAGFLKFSFDEWKQLVIELKKMRKDINRKNKIKLLDKIISSLKKNIPVILTFPSVEPAGYRFKTELNENAKMPAIFSGLPEAIHNEIMNLASIKKENNIFSLLIFESKFDLPLMKKMSQAVQQMLYDNFEDIFVLKVKSNNLLEEILKLVFLGDLISLKVALKRKVDPTPVDFIDKVKELIKNKKI